MYMNDVMYHLKAPNVNFMRIVVTLILVFILLTEKKKAGCVPRKFN